MLVALWFVAEVVVAPQELICADDALEVFQAA